MVHFQLFVHIKSAVCLQKVSCLFTFLDPRLVAILPLPRSSSFSVALPKLLRLPIKRSIYLVCKFLSISQKKENFGLWMPRPYLLFLSMCPGHALYLLSNEFQKQSFFLRELLFTNRLWSQPITIVLANERTPFSLSQLIGIETSAMRLLCQQNDVLLVQRLSTDWTKSKVRGHKTHKKTESLP